MAPILSGVTYRMIASDDDAVNSSIDENLVAEFADCPDLLVLPCQCWSHKCIKRYLIINTSVYLDMDYCVSQRHF